MKELMREFGRQKVRVVIIHGEPWFVAKDVCDALGLDQVSRALDRIDQDERGLLKVTHPQSKDKTLEVAAVTESGLYELVLRSEKPEAKNFKRWVTHEVLPSIRKTGKYEISNQARKESAAMRNSLTAQWLAHGADKFYHYINLTRAEYLALFGDAGRKKETMSAEEIAALRLFESLEFMKLSVRKDIDGYKGLHSSIESTGKLLPGIKAELINGRAS
jgi:prophage antirepressor-like protein